MSGNIYQKMYISLFNDVAQAIEDFKNGQKTSFQVMEDLEKFQQQTEQIYIDNDESDEDNDNNPL